MIPHFFRLMGQRLLLGRARERRHSPRRLQGTLVHQRVLYRRRFRSDDLNARGANVFFIRRWQLARQHQSHGGAGHA